MGTLKPGVTYIYERVDNVIYAREFGAHPSTRFVIDRNYKSEKDDGQPDEAQEWHDYDPDC
jgi:hypothetical protein